MIIIRNMKFEQFRQAVAQFPVFGLDPPSGASWSRAQSRLQFSRWVKAGHLLRLKRGLYCLPPGATPRFSLTWLANRLYSPSYLSFEFMLSWYDLIPERVAVLTSISTRKTLRLTNSVGQFVYRTLQPSHFFGFEERRDEYQAPVLMAQPEKALLDYIYLSRDWQATPQYIVEGLRLQQLDQLNFRRLAQWAEAFHSKKLIRAVAVLRRCR